MINFTAIKNFASLTIFSTVIVVLSLAPAGYTAYMIT